MIETIRCLVYLVRVVFILMVSFKTCFFAADVGAETQFVDVTLETSIDFEHIDGRSGQKFLRETLGCGVALLDFNADGYHDIYCVNADTLPGTEPSQPICNRLYRVITAT